MLQPTTRLAPLVAPVAAAILLWSGAWPATAQPRGTVRKVILRNGMRLITREDHSVPLVGIALSAAAGFAVEPAGKEGLAELAARALLEPPDGSGGDAMRRLFDVSGHDTMASADEVQATIGFTVPADRLGDCLAVIARVTSPGAFDAACVDRARAKLIKDLQDARSSPLAGGYLRARLDDLIFGAHPYAPRWQARLRALPNLTAHDVEEFRDRWFVPNGLALAVVGDVDEGKVLDEVQKLFGGRSAGPARVGRVGPVPPVDKPRHAEESLDVSQPLVTVGFLGPSLMDRACYAMELIQTIMATGHSSRLHRRLVDREQIAEDVDAHFSARPEASPFSVALAVKSGDPQAAIDAILKACDHLRRQGVTPEELARAKTLRKSLHVFQQQKRGVVAQTFARFEIMDEVDTAERFTDDLDRVTADEVRAAAQRYLDPAHVVSLVIQPSQASHRAATGLQTYTLPNGLRLAVRPTTSSDVVGVAVSAMAGPRREGPRERGITQVLGRLLETGATRSHAHADIARQLEDVGAVLQTDILPDSLVVRLNATVFNLDEVLGTLREVVLEPQLSDAEVASARLWLADQGRAVQDEPEEHRMEVFMMHFGIGSPYDGLYHHSPELSRVDATTVRAFHQKIMVPANMVVGIAGNVDPERMRQRIEATFGDMPQAAAPVPDRTDVAALASERVEEMSVRRGDDFVMAGFPLSPECHKDSAALSVCLRALGIGRESALTRHLAAIDPAAQGRAGLQILQAGGWLIFGAEVKAGAADATVKALRSAIEEFRSGTPDAAWIARTRDLVVTYIMRGFEESETHAENAAVSLGTFGDASVYDKLAASYEKLKPEDITRAARQYLANPYIFIMKGKRE